MMRVDVHGAPVTPATTAEIRALVQGWLREGHKGTVCCANVHVVETARHNDELALALRNADLVLADGAPVAWLAARKLGRPVPRVTGSDFFRLFALDGESGGRHFLFGSTNANVHRFASAIQSANPGIEIAGALAPPFGAKTFAELEKSVEEINSAGADFVWVGLGAPKQELWMYRARPLLEAPVVAGVGAVFDFVSGGRSRAPDWLQHAGLEWAFRLAQEPRRLGPRYLATNTTFVLGVARDIFGGTP